MVPKTDILIRIRPSTSLKYKVVAKASRQLCNVRSSAQKREGKQCSKAQDSFGMTTGDHRIGSRKWTVVKEEESPKEIYEIEITHREKKRLQNMLDKKKRIQREFKTKNPQCGGFFWKTTKLQCLQLWVCMFRNRWSKTQVVE